MKFDDTLVWYYDKSMKNNDQFDMISFLRSEQIDEHLIQGVSEFRKQFLPAEQTARTVRPHFLYYGTQVWNQALTAILCGSNILLSGAKATGKNVLAENLAYAFGRPYWNVSFHINMDAAGMIGTDTFKDGKVMFRPGPVYECAVKGGFGILDEINMARNEALAVLHSILDYRRVIDIPGYDIIKVDDAARFIATMNYGYTGTRELNEALASRFAVITLPVISNDDMKKLLKGEFPGLKEKALEQFAGLYNDLQLKTEHGEISGRAVDLRGLIDAIKFMKQGLDVKQSLRMGITGKCFDASEEELVDDVIKMRIGSESPSSYFSD